eukprot:gnl/Trimastix_PCT/1189.p1 GENE.gnl/Trimastix_PCT/1189~~gnl/Trimastix_PCT/1189.p1  ORF type:complete len:656 (+),score=202.92 gnl/Trimastix_PCT/1189:41-2008(+)
MGNCAPFSARQKALNSLPDESYFNSRLDHAKISAALASPEGSQMLELFLTVHDDDLHDKKKLSRILTQAYLSELQASPQLIADRLHKLDMKHATLTDGQSAQSPTPSPKSSPEPEITIAPGLDVKFELLEVEMHSATRSPSCTLEVESGTGCISIPLVATASAQGAGKDGQSPEYVTFIPTNPRSITVRPHVTFRLRMPEAGDPHGTQEVELPLIPCDPIERDGSFDLADGQRGLVATLKCRFECRRYLHGRVADLVGPLQHALSITDHAAHRSGWGLTRLWELVPALLAAGSEAATPAPNTQVPDPEAKERECACVAQLIRDMLCREIAESNKCWQYRTMINLSSLTSLARLLSIKPARVNALLALGRLANRGARIPPQIVRQCALALVDALGHTSPEDCAALAAEFRTLTACAAWAEELASCFWTPEGIEVLHRLGGEDGKLSEAASFVGALHLVPPEGIPPVEIWNALAEYAASPSGPIQPILVELDRVLNAALQDTAGDKSRLGDCAELLARFLDPQLHDGIRERLGRAFLDSPQLQHDAAHSPLLAQLGTDGALVKLVTLTKRLAVAGPLPEYLVSLLASAVAKVPVKGHVSYLLPVLLGAPEPAPALAELIASLQALRSPAGPRSSEPVERAFPEAAQEAKAEPQGTAG